MRPLLIVSDIHLGQSGSEAVPSALAELVRHHPHHEIIFAGDVFNLSTDPRELEPIESVVSKLAPLTKLNAALRDHVGDGGEVVLLPGNHDAEVVTGGMREAVLACLELGPEAPLEIRPWFICRNGIHIEHGHVYDPDNAPTHPLSPWTQATAPLGISLTRRFLAPSGALAFAHAHETTPVAGLLRAFRIFGPRAPKIIATYFYVAAKLVREAGRQPGIEEERQAGAIRLAEHATAVGLKPEQLRALLDQLPPPTHHDRRSTFLRLYFDRVITACAGSIALAAMFRHPRAGGALAAAAAAYLVSSVKMTGNRYEHRVEQALEHAADFITGSTPSHTVVFGHTHRAKYQPPYVNTGSFAYPGRTATGRPYAHVDEQGTVTLRAL